VSAFLLERSHWVKRRGFTAKSIARVIDTAIKCAKKVKNVTAQPGTGGAAGAPEEDVEKRIGAQAGYWRCSIDDVKAIVSVVGKMLPLVGGVQRGTGAYEGPPRTTRRPYRRSITSTEAAVVVAVGAVAVGAAAVVMGAVDTGM